MLLLVPFFLLFIGFTLPAQAFEVRSGDLIHIDEDEKIDGTFYAAAQTITIDGDIHGDVICAAQTININGHVDGDVICAGQTIIINNDVAGNVRVAGNAIHINNNVGKNVMTFGTTIMLSPDAEIEGDMLIGAADADIRGKINKTLHGGASKVLIKGFVGDGVFLDLGDSENNHLVIAENSRIGGNVEYNAKEKAEISEKASIKGEVKQKLPAVAAMAKQKKQNADSVSKFGIFFSVFSSILVGLILIFFWKDAIKRLKDNMIDNIGQSIGWGLLILITTPLAVVIIAVTIIGIPLAIILLITYLITLYLCKILAAMFIGRKVLDVISPGKEFSLIWNLVTGVILLQIVSFIPFIGSLIIFLATIWTLGAIAMMLRHAPYGTWFRQGD